MERIGAEWFECACLYKLERIEQLSLGRCCSRLDAKCTKRPAKLLKVVAQIDIRVVVSLELKAIDFLPVGYVARDVFVVEILEEMLNSIRREIFTDAQAPQKLSFVVGLVLRLKSVETLLDPTKDSGV